MKHSRELVKKAVLDFWDAYCTKRNLEKVAECVTDDFCWYGTGAFEHAGNRDELLDLMGKEFISEPDRYEYRVEDLEVLDITAECQYVYGEMKFAKNLPDVKQKIYMDTRFTAVCKLTEDGWKAAAVHIAVPNAYQDDEEYFPLNFGQKTIQDLSAEAQKESLELLQNSVAGGMIGGYMEPGFPLYFVNQRLLDYLGYEGYDEFYEDIGGFVSNGMHPEDREEVNKAVSQQLKESNTYEVQYRMMKKNGSFIWVFDRGSVIKAEDGRDAIISIIIDVTEWQKKSDETIARENAKFNFLLCNMCENFMEVDIATHQSSLSRPKEDIAWTDSFERQIQEFADNVVVPEERERYLKEFDVDRLIENINANDGMYVVSFNVNYEDGRHYLVIYNTLLKIAGDKEYIFLYAQDMTDIKNETERNKKAIEEALEKAEQASEAKTNFLSHMSHEIRTPLNGIIGMQTLMKEADSMEEMKQYLEKADISAQQLLYIVNDILDMSKIESGKLVLDKKMTDPTTATDRVKGIIEPMAYGKGIALEFTEDTEGEEGYCVYADANRLVQILLNLLSNGVKYTSRGGKVQMNRKAEKLDENTIREIYTVADTGVGMSEEFQKKLFEPFEQESAFALKEGTGLGLTITKLLVDAMGGTIEIQSVQGKGTTVCVKIDLERVKMQAGDGKESKEEDGSAGEDIRVLVMEDNKINLEIETKLLESFGLTVDTAVDGLSGLEMFKQSEEGFYQVIFTDIMMPGLDGYGVARAIRRLERTDSRKVCIVAVTANAFLEDIRKTKANGMDYHVSKPFEREDLLNIIKDVRSELKKQKQRK